MPSDEDKRKKEAKQDAIQRRGRDKAPAKYEFGLGEGPFHEQYPERQQSVPAPAPAQGPTITVMPNPQAIPAPQPISEPSPRPGAESSPRPSAEPNERPVTPSGNMAPSPAAIPEQKFREFKQQEPPPPDIKAAEVKATKKGKLQTLFERLRTLVGTRNEEVLLLAIKQGKSEKHLNKIRDTIATSMPLDNANTDALTGILQEIRRESWHTQFRGGLSGTVLIPTQSTMDAIAQEIHSIHHPPSPGPSPSSNR